jgi:hypothetical protein
MVRIGGLLAILPSVFALHGNWDHAQAPPAPPGTLAYPYCQPEATFTNLFRFGGNILVHSNLGGLPGPCNTLPYQEGIWNSSLSHCDTGTSTADTPQEIYIRHLGDDQITNDIIDLIITNVTEYRAWKSSLNGITTSESEEHTPFVRINVRSPRSGGTEWDNTETHTILKYQFVKNADRTPHFVNRTFLTFFGACSAWFDSPHASASHFNVR